MRYLCLIYFDEKNLDALSEKEYNAHVDDALDYVDELRSGSHLVAADGLLSVQTATTLRVRGGKLSITDGPFAETKEQLGGFYLIEAKDLNEAIQLASKIPSIQFGCVEVRPVRELTHS